MLHILSDQAQSFLTTYFFVGIGLTGVSFFSGWFKKSYDGPLKQAWGIAERLKTEKQSLEAKVAQIRQEYQYQARQIEQYKAQAEAYAAQIKTLETRYLNLETRYEHLAADYHTIQENYAASQSHCQNLEFDLRDLSAKLENADYDNEQLRQAYQAQEQELVAQTTAHQQLQESYRLLEAEQVTLNAQWQSTKIEYEALQANYQELQETITEIQGIYQQTRIEITDLEKRVTKILADNDQLLADNLWREERLRKLRFWEWLMGGCNNYVPRSKSLLTFYVGMPLQAWWSNLVNLA
ncbi:hypothetical protein [Synechococcus sp. PCC 6312]|uniref:hypothetical protein n=1 Tax=Synechococcus sp. (strain ATCC 27167 / PCC 6312) TaxID=195253 RepID=UPI00029F26F1|nr:hypothetical protein [Synechococcus sp. PCC 6312]AFY62764.1 hypothetical protein Syn6312_3753 [Synechococcus sp. PCC 6312]